MPSNHSAIRTIIPLSAVALGLAACSPRAAPNGATIPVQQTPQQYHLTATVQDLMEGLIDPSADVLWDSVAYIATTKGIEDRQPRTDDEWKTVRKSAVTLIEAANLLSMPGRTVAAAPGSQLPPTPEGELAPPEIQQRISSTHPAFVQFARNLQEAGLKALVAIDAKDAPALMEAGGRIDEACEACHTTYWYPNQQRSGN